MPIVKMIEYNHQFFNEMKHKRGQWRNKMIWIINKQRVIDILSSRITESFPLKEKGV